MRALAHSRAALALMGALAGWCAAGEQAPKERVVELGGGVKMTLVFIPAGSFTMGCTEAAIKALLAKWPEAKEESFAGEKPAPKVTISKAFWMGKHEVMVGQFRRFVDGTGYKTDAEKGTPDGFIPKLKGKVAEDHNWRKPHPAFSQTDEHPVIMLSWNDAVAFADWLNATDGGKPAGSSYRLPTEAEWEYACRAGTTTWYQWGDDPDRGKGWCNASDMTAKKTWPFPWLGKSVFNWEDGFVFTAPVGSFKANAFGLHDMHGNVREWCQDWYGPYKEGDQTDPAGPDSGRHRVLRGGGWTMAPWHLCPEDSHDRNGGGPAFRGTAQGFRVALSAGQ